MFFFPLILGGAKTITNLLKIDIFLKDGPESLSVEGPRSINGKEEVKLKCSSSPSNRVVRWETTLIKYVLSRGTRMRTLPNICQACLEDP